MQQLSAPLGHFFAMRRISEAMWTVSRFHRGHRIVAAQLSNTWHVIVDGHTGSVVKHIESPSFADAMAQAEWIVETRLGFRPPSRDERMVG